MLHTFKKISVRKLSREKGKSLCIILALFLTTIMFITIFSTVFFLKDALEEMSRGLKSWIGDAGFIVSDLEAEAVENSNLVSDTTYGLHIGEIENSKGYVDIELVTYKDKMAHWMKCYPTVGCMPDKDNEIVVSRKYLENHNINYQKNKIIDITYSVDGTKYMDYFTLVGLYDRDIHSKNVMLFSKNFYDKVSGRLQEEGKNSRNILFKMVEVIYHSSSNIEETTYQLMDEIGFNKDNGFVMNDNFTTGESISAEIYVILGSFILFVMTMGYLFISNIFSISIDQDIKFYGKLLTNGVLKSEIKKMILFQNNILFLIAIIPALIVGFIFTSLILPKLLNSFFIFQIGNKSNVFIFILAIVFSYLTLILSSRKQIKITKKISPMGIKRYLNKFKIIKNSNNKNCLNKFIMRKYHNDIKSALKIYISIAISILLANLFYTIVVGFNEEEYISSNMKSDYTVANTSFYSEMDNRNRKNISSNDIAEYIELPGLIQSGGGGICGINIVMNDIQTKEYDEIVGDSNLNYYKPGNMYTYIYGLDEIMVKKMNVLDGSIDLKEYRTGKYVIIDSLGDDGKTCFHVGDSITLSFQSGNSKNYTIMAVAELPYEISFQSKWMGSFDIFLPFTEWSNNTGISDYYMYTYDVEEDYKKLWDDTLSSMINNNLSLTYHSAKTLANKNKDLINEIKIVGFVLCAILLCMGILNFINCTVSSIYNRRKELAIMQSMGTTKAEIIGALVKEGILYMVGGIILGGIISVLFIRLAVDEFLIIYCVHYKFNLFIYMLFALIGLITAVLVPWISYIYMDKKEPFLVRIKSCRE